MTSAARVFVAAGAMNDATCRAVQAAMDAGEVEPSEILDDEIAVADDVRRASHVEVPEAVLAVVERCLDAQRGGLEAFFARRCSPREGVSLLRYEAGGFYRRHVDRADVPSWPAAAQRAVTVVLFLNSARDSDPVGEFSGGLLRLLPEDGAPIEIAATRGTLVAFAADIAHEVTPVTAGRRDAVVDWFLDGDL